MDSLDYGIIDLLRQNARAGYGDIGEVIGLSASAVKRRVDRAGVPEVGDAGTVTGSADAIVHMRSRDIPSLEIALEKVRIAPNVDHTRSAIVLSRLIHRTHD